MAQDLNHFEVIGRLTKDVGSDERSYGTIGNGTTKAVASIAVNRPKKQGDKWEDDVSYFDIVIFGKQAENLKPYLLKGKQICVEAHLHQDRWEKDGQKRSAISIIADHVQLLGNRGEGSGDSGKSQKSVSSEPNQDFSPSDGFPEDIPF